MKKKILILASWFPSKASPVNGIFIQEQAVVLSKIYNVAVLTPRIPVWKNIITGKDHSKSYVEYRDDFIVFSEKLFLPPKIFFYLWKFMLFKSIQKSFNKVLSVWGKPDLIHSHVILPGGCAALKLGDIHGIPIVLTEHSGPYSVHLRTKSQRSIVRNLLPKFDRVISVSPSLSNQIQSFCPLIDINTVGNVIRTDFFKSVNCTSNLKVHKKPQFLCIAFLKENKGIHYFIEAIFSLVNRGITSFDVIIGGDGPARAKLENMAKKLGLSDLCKFLGLLTRQEVRYWMQRCDVFVLPSLSETFGVVLGEAMACGKPVIATRCGGPEFLVLPETGLLVDVADSNALADAMYKFINKQVKFDSCLIRRSISDRFGENAFLTNISKIYEQLWDNPT